MILYGRGLIAEEYCRYLEAQGRGEDIEAFAVTKMNGQGNTYCGRPCLEIEEAIKIFPKAEIHLTLQEKYHEEVIGLLAELGREPKEIIGLHRMTQLLGEQGIKEISEACSDLIVNRNPYDYSMLEISPKEHPEARFTFYPMTQVPLSQPEIRYLHQTVSKFSNGSVTSSPYLHRARGARSVEVQWTSRGWQPEGLMEGGQSQLYLAMATSLKDARVSMENLPDYVHPVMGGTAGYDGPRTAEMAYDDEESDTLSSYNSLYSELTVAHWLWKKAPWAKYLGLCHYRRHFVLTEEIKKAMAEGKVDVLLTTPRLTFPTVHAYFAGLPVTTMDEQDYSLMLRLIEHEDSELANFSKEFLEGQIHYPNNMVIAKREIYLAYCRFMFKVLHGMQEHYKKHGIARPDRYLGYVGELLTTVYFAWYCEKYRVAYIDYKLLREV